jgi:hypothetical protein
MQYGTALATSQTLGAVSANTGPTGIPPNQPVTCAAWTFTELINSEWVAVTPGEILSAGPHTINATCSPQSDLYIAKSTSPVVITVTQSLPVVTYKPASTTLVYGAPLNASKLDAVTKFNGQLVVGTTVYYYDVIDSNHVATVGTVLEGGSHTITAVFTPQDNQTYATAQSAPVTFTVTPAKVTVTWFPVPTAIPYGQPILAGQFDAKAFDNKGNPVEGSFAYAENGTAVSVGQTTLEGGHHVITATFTPSAPADYMAPKPAQRTITITPYTQVTLSYNPWPATIFYTAGIVPSQLNATAVDANGDTVSGSFSYTSSGTTVIAGTILTAGVHTVTATFVPDDVADYGKKYKAEATITVDQSVPNVTYIPAIDGTNPSALLYYGMPMGSAELDATVNDNSDPGTFVYTDGNGKTVKWGTILQAGSHTVTATFDPADSHDYAKHQSAQATIVISQWTPTLNIGQHQSDYIAGYPMSQVFILPHALDYNKVDVPGKFVYKINGKVVNYNTYTLKSGANQVLEMDFTPSDSVDYITPTPLTVTFSVP